MDEYDINQLINMKNNILQKKRETPKTNTDLIKQLNNEYSKIQMKIKYYSNDDYRKNKCKLVSAYNKAHIEAYNNYQKLYQRSKNKK